MEDINILAVIIAAFSTFMIGGIWYGPLFYKPWLKESGLSEADLKKRNMITVFGLSFLSALLSAIFLEYLIDNADLSEAILKAVLIGIIWIAGSIGVTYLFENKSLKLFLIDAGYHAISFTVMGFILGLM